MRLATVPAPPVMRMRFPFGRGVQFRPPAGASMGRSMVLLLVVLRVTTECALHPSRSRSRSPRELLHPAGLFAWVRYFGFGGYLVHDASGFFRRHTCIAHNVVGEHPSQACSRIRGVFDVHIEAVELIQQFWHVVDYSLSAASVAWRL